MQDKFVVQIYSSKMCFAVFCYNYCRSSSDVFPILLSGPTGVGKKTVVMATSRKLNLHVVDVDCYELCGDTTASTEARMRNSFHKGIRIIMKTLTNKLLCTILLTTWSPG